MTFKELILDHLKKRGSITSMEAYDRFGCTRLSHYIYLLRKDGYIIENKTEKSINRHGSNVHFDRYVLVAENER